MSEIDDLEAYVTVHAPIESEVHMKLRKNALKGMRTVFERQAMKNRTNRKEPLYSRVEPSMPKFKCMED